MNVIAFVYRASLFQYRLRFIIDRVKHISQNMSLLRLQFPVIVRARQINNET